MSITANSDGSVDFIKDKVIFRFEKDNYQKHIAKRVKLEHARFLNEIESTLLDPDCITQGPKTNSNKNFYRVFSYQDSRDVRYVSFWKIPVFYRNKKLAIIATCIDKYSPNFYAINALEKIIWKKPNSQI